MEGNDMDIEPIWADYVTFDEDGNINGVREDAPEEAKKEFAKYWRQKKKNESSKEPILKY